MERLLRRSEYKQAKEFISGLRNKKDPAPQILKAPTIFEGARVGICPLNSLNYCKKYPNYEPVIGFKMWVRDVPGSPAGICDWCVATTHVVVRNKDNANYTDVTPPNPGDEGQESIFVPSSRLYTDWSVETIVEYMVMGLSPMLGSVRGVKELKLHLLDEATRILHKMSIVTPTQLKLRCRLAKSTPEEIKLTLKPTTNALLHTYPPNISASSIKAALKRSGAEFFSGVEEECILDASVYRNMMQSFNAK